MSLRGPEEALKISMEFLNSCSRSIKCSQILSIKKRIAWILSLLVGLDIVSLIIA